MKSRKAITHITKRMTSAFVMWVFLFNTLPVSALQITRSSTLAPELSIVRQDSREKIAVMAGVVSHEALNAYIRHEVEKLIEVKGKDWVDGLVARDLPVPIPSIIKRTGYFAHVGLGRQYGKPVIYIDTDVFDDTIDREKVMRHENYEVNKWEDIRRELKLSSKDMRAWIIRHLDDVVPELDSVDMEFYRGKTVRGISLMIHGAAPSIDQLYEKYGLKTKIDVQYLIELLNRYDGNAHSKSDIFVDPKNSKDIVLSAAGPFDSPELTDNDVKVISFIGRGFSAGMARDIDIKPWHEFQGCKNAVDGLKKKLQKWAREKSRPFGMRYALRRMSFILTKITSGGYGDNTLGVTSIRYIGPDRYQFAYMLNNSVCFAKDFFDPDSPFAPYAEEALFRSLFYLFRLEGKSRDMMIETALMAHQDALKYAALLFWDLGEQENAKVLWEDPEYLELHSKNGLNQTIFDWQSSQVNIEEAVQRDYWNNILQDLQLELRTAGKNPRGLFRLMKRTNDVVLSKSLYPVEAQYPMLRAVTLLTKDEKIKLLKILESRGATAINDLIIVDSIIMMLKQEATPRWLSKQAPNLEGRAIWQVSSEIWNPAGGLGRVMQSHGIAMQQLLATGGTVLRHIEPRYRYKIDINTNALVELDYDKIAWLGRDNIPEADRMREVDRFEIDIGGEKAAAIWYYGRNPYGIYTYQVSGYKCGIKNLEGKTEGELAKINPYYTRILYNYGTPFHNPLDASLAEFSAFLSAASLEFMRRFGAREKEELGRMWKPPIIHANDGQLGLLPLFRKVFYSNDDILKDAFVAYTTHTYRNRCFFESTEGEMILRWLNIPEEHWGYFAHRVEGFRPVIDLTSAGIRTADWVNGVSVKHVEDIIKKQYDNGWGAWKNIMIKAVTNGDIRARTAVFFRDFMKEVCGEKVDVENPTAEQVLRTKHAAKEYLNERFVLDKYNQHIDPDLPIVSYSGRGVEEKISPTRAFSDRNIEEMLKRGYQVVLGCNTQSDGRITGHLSGLASSLNQKGYKGKCVVLCNITIEDQRAILAATDVQIQDSDKDTEAAGYTEANVGACGGLELAPSWTEGLLQAQGIRLNFDVTGEGNTLIPKDGNPDSYLEVLDKLFSKTPMEIAEYQTTAVRLSLVLEAFLTSAAYLREWSVGIAKKEGRFPAEPQSKGSPASGLRYFYENRIFEENPITVEELSLLRGYSVTSSRIELDNLVRLGLVTKDDSEREYKYYLVNSLARAPPEDAKRTIGYIVDIRIEGSKILNLYTIPEHKFDAVNVAVKNFLTTLPKYSAGPVSGKIAALSEAILERLDRNIDNGLKILSGAGSVSAKLKEGRVYVVRVNRGRLSDVPYGASIVKAYIELLKLRAVDPKNIILKYSNKVALVSVESYKDRDDYNSNRVFGEGSIGVQGSLKNKELDLVGLLNMAMAASNIRTSLATGQRYDDYERSLIGLIRDQYKHIYGNALTVPDEGVLYFIKDLPPIDRPLPIDSVELYYKLTYQKLQQAA